MVRSSIPKKKGKKLFCLRMGRTATRSPLRMTSVICCPTRPTIQSMTGSKISLTSLLWGHPISVDRHQHKSGTGLGGWGLGLGTNEGMV